MGSLRAVVMPMSSGKTTLAKKYPRLMFDVDQLITPEAHAYLDTLRDNARASNDWGKYNNAYYSAANDGIKTKKIRDIDGFVLLHDVSMANALNLIVYLVAMPSDDLFEVMLKRKNLGKSYNNLAKRNRNEVLTALAGRDVLKFESLSELEGQLTGVSV